MCLQFLFSREHAPSIIFMDEVDSIGSARTENSGGGGDSEVQRTMLELLNQLDGFEASNKIKVRRDAVFVLLCRGTCVHAWLYSATCVD
jgi:ATP-dependent 26S proteasome regulatory subunit